MLFGRDDGRMVGQKTVWYVVKDGCVGRCHEGALVQSSLSRLLIYYIIEHSRFE